MRDRVFWTQAFAISTFKALPCLLSEKVPLYSIGHSRDRGMPARQAVVLRLAQAKTSCKKANDAPSAYPIRSLRDAGLHVCLHRPDVGRCAALRRRTASHPLPSAPLRCTRANYDSATSLRRRMVLRTNKGSSARLRQSLALGHCAATHDLTVAALGVPRVYAPPAYFLLHDLAWHCQMPTAERLTEFLPHAGHG